MVVVKDIANVVVGIIPVNSPPNVLQAGCTLVLLHYIVVAQSVCNEESILGSRSRKWIWEKVPCQVAFLVLDLHA